MTIKINAQPLSAHAMPLPLMLAVMLSGPTVAQDSFVPAVTVRASPVQIDGRAIDILALVPGMSVQEVKAGLAAHYTSPTTTEPTYFQVGSRGVEIKTVEFISALKSGGSDDAVVAFFAGPAADNQAFAIEREVHYSDVLTAPTVATITEALLTKYGEASYKSADYREKPSPQLVWTFAGGALAPCQGFGGYGSGDPCPTAWTLSEYKLGNLDVMARDVLDFDLAIVANLETHQADRSKVSAFTVTVSDLQLRKQAANADMQALLAELERVHQQASKPAAAPAL